MVEIFDAPHSFLLFGCRILEVIASPLVKSSFRERINDSANRGKETRNVGCILCHLRYMTLNSRWRHMNHGEDDMLGSWRWRCIEPLHQSTPREFRIAHAISTPGNCHK